MGLWEGDGLQDALGPTTSLVELPGPPAGPIASEQSALRVIPCYPHTAGP